MSSHLRNICKKTRHFLKNERGQGLVEYALILVLIAVVTITAITTLGHKTENVFSNIGSKL